MTERNMIGENMNGEIAIQYTEDEMASAWQKLKTASDWRSRNPRTYEIIEQLAFQEAARGRKFGGKFLAEVTRQKDIPLDSGRGTFRLSNNYTGVFARWIALEHPEMAQLIRMRPCALDVVMGLTPSFARTGSDDGTT